MSPGEPSEPTERSDSASPVEDESTLVSRQPDGEPLLEPTVEHEGLPDVGSKIGKYELLEKLGSGGMSVVYKAKDLALDRLVAIKLLLPQKNSKQIDSMRFQQEARAASRLEHPNIVKVHDFNVTDDGVPYLVMSYLEGIPLSEEIKKSGGLEPGLWLSIMVQACDALSHAHAHGVVHRDIKPSNFVLCTEKGNQVLKLVDFGIAKIESNEDQALTKTGEIFGSPLYMSPEQCAGSKEVDSRSDVYSLGCVMYEALAGRPPFSGENALATIVKHLNEKPVSLVFVRKDVKSIDAADKIVMKCLEKKPEDRYPDTLSVRKELESAFLRREFKRKKRGYKPLILTAMAIILLPVGISWYQQYQKQAVVQQKKQQYEESIRLCRSGRKHIRESDFDKGLNDLSRSLVLATAAGAPNIYLAYLNAALGNVELRKRNMASGRTYYLKVINLALPPNDRRTVELRYEAYVQLGNDAKYHRHENKEAIPYYKKALINARLLDKTRFIITMLLELNMLSDAIGDKDAAEAYMKEIESYPKRLGDVADAIEDFKQRQTVYTYTERMKKQVDRIQAERALERQKKLERNEKDEAREKESDHKADLRTEQLKKEWGKTILE
ncbi:MAG: hypothetical protein DKT66_22780 [Candidatus Melainabacteria bacterium]|nr:MAG: hypothetical protein DKT66_22780 [Candidatus Melainabacteria bacterium]